MDAAFLASYAPIPILHRGREYVVEPHMLGGIGTVPPYWEGTLGRPLVWGIFIAHSEYRDDPLHSFHSAVDQPPTECDRAAVESAAHAWLDGLAQDA